MSGFEDVYAPPTTDAALVAEVTSDDEPQAEALLAYWYAIPLWRLFLFGLLGGNFYLLHYMFRAWDAHRASFGYSAQQRWRDRYAATGFRVSPFWRAALQIYSYSWLLVVDREARREKLPGFGPAGLWFVLQVVSLLLLPFAWRVVVLSVVFLPAQAAVNRLHDKATRSTIREPITAAELCWLGFGTIAMLMAFKAGGAR